MIATIAHSKKTKTKKKTETHPDINLWSSITNT